MDWIVDFIAKYWWAIILAIAVGLFLRKPRGRSDDDDQPPGPACPA